LIYSLGIRYSENQQGNDPNQLRNGKPLRFVFWGFCDPLPDLSALGDIG
jgi:hypothetical protein